MKTTTQEVKDLTQEEAEKINDTLHCMINTVFEANGIKKPKFISLITINECTEDSSRQFGFTMANGRICKEERIEIMGSVEKLVDALTTCKCGNCHK